MKFFVIILISLGSLKCIAQDYKEGKFIYIDDTIEVTNYLNGEWKFKINSTKHKVSFHFDNDTLICVDSIYLNWYEETKTKYELVWDGCCRILLRSYCVDWSSKSFGENYFEYELWPVDKKKMAVNIGGDFGVYIFRKVKR
jgi:hypothetical protein